VVLLGLLDDAHEGEKIALPAEHVHSACRAVQDVVDYPAGSVSSGSRHGWRLAVHEKRVKTSCVPVCVSPCMICAIRA
jgi:hypothetical protein